MPLVRPATSTQNEPIVAAVEIEKAVSDWDLESRDASERRMAVRQAVRAGEAALLVRHLPSESDAGIRETILTSLVRIGGAEAVKPLLTLLRSEHAGLRNAVIETLQSMGDVVAPELESLLEDPDSDVRIFAVNVLHSMKSERVPDIALRVASSDPHVNVCAAAVDILAEVGRPEMAGALRDVARRFPDQLFLAFAIRAALKRIG
jgi:HEAT repeat protein